MGILSNTCAQCGAAHTRTLEAPFCEPCMDRCDAEASEQQQRATVSARERRWLAVAPKAYRNTKPELLPTDKAREYYSRIGNWKMTEGVTLSGPTGSGKTRIACRALRVAFDAGQSIDVLPAAELRIRLWQSFEAGSKVLDAASKPQVLLLDDLGQGAKSEQADEVLLALLERRTSAEKLTIVTTQYTAERLAARFFSVEIGEAIIRRIGNQFATSLKL